jgi:hypothetical protein
LTVTDTRQNQQTELTGNDDPPRERLRRYVAQQVERLGGDVSLREAACTLPYLYAEILEWHEGAESWPRPVAGISATSAMLVWGNERTGHLEVEVLRDGQIEVFAFAHNADGTQTDLVEADFGGTSSGLFAAIRCVLRAGRTLFECPGLTG